MKFVHNKTTFNIELPKNGDFYNRLSLRKKFYELDLLEYIKKNAKHGGIYIDVGGGWGNHSIYFRKYLADRVLSIEPVNFKLLEHNIKLNNLDIQILPFGCGDKDGVASHVERGQLKSGIGNIKIKTLDSIYEEHGNNEPVNFIKIDVEGWEYKVVSGAINTIKRFSPDISMEDAKQWHKQYVDAENILTDLGYKVLGCFCNTPTYYLSKR